MATVQHINGRRDKEFFAFCPATWQKVAILVAAILISVGIAGLCRDWRPLYVFYGMEGLGIVLIAAVLITSALREYRRPKISYDEFAFLMRSNREIGLTTSTHEEAELAQIQGFKAEAVNLKLGISGRDSFITDPKMSTMAQIGAFYKYQEGTTRWNRNIDLFMDDVGITPATALILHDRAQSPTDGLLHDEEEIAPNRILAIIPPPLPSLEGDALKNYFRGEIIKVLSQLAKKLKQ